MWTVQKKRIDLENDISNAYSSVETGILPQYSVELEKALGAKSLCFVLSSIGTYYAILGAIKVLDGDPSGWQGIYRGWSYQALFATVTAFQIDNFGKTKSPRSTPPDFLTEEFAIVLPGAIVFGEFEFAKQFGQTYLRAFTSGDPIHKKRQWDQRSFEPFTAVLWAKWTQQPLPKKFDGRKKSKNSDVTDGYWRIEDEWESGVSADAIRSGCEEFIRQSDDFGRRSPYDVFPAEFRWIKQLLGKDFPKVKHPVLDNPLFTDAPKIKSLAKDPWLERTILKCQELQPGLTFEINGLK